VFTHCLVHRASWPPNWGPRPAILDGDVQVLVDPQGGLWLDPWTTLGPVEASLLGPAPLDAWVAGISQSGRELFLRIKLLRNHCLMGLMVLDELAENLSRLIGRTVPTSEVLSAVNEAGWDFPRSWWSLVGHEDDLDEYGLREGVQTDQGLLYRIEGWRLADALAGHTTDGARPFDDAQWVWDTAGHSTMREARAEDVCSWRDGDSLLERPVPGVQVEILVHENILEQAKTKPSVARACHEFRTQMHEAIPQVFEAYGARVFTRGLSRSVGGHAAQLPR